MKSPASFLLFVLVISSHLAGAQRARTIVSPPGMYLSLTTLGTVQRAPSNLTALAGYRYLINCCRVDWVSLTWKDNSTNEYSFRVERCAGATCTNFAEVVKTAPNTTHVFQTFYYARGRVYRYRVRARGPYGFSAYTNIVTVKLP